MSYSILPCTNKLQIILSSSYTILHKTYHKCLSVVGLSSRMQFTHYNHTHSSSYSTRRLWYVLCSYSTLQSAFVQVNTEYNTLPPSYILLLALIIKFFERSGLESENTCKKKTYHYTRLLDHPHNIIGSNL